MNVQQTSIECYNKIKESGLLARCKMEAYTALWHTRPATAAEAYDWHIRKYGGVPNLNLFRSRFTMLKDEDVIEEVGERNCRITGMNVIVWDVTDRLPKKPQRKKSPGSLRQEYMNELIKNLTHFHARVDIFYKQEVLDMLNLALLITKTK